MTVSVFSAASYRTGRSAGITQKLAVETHGEAEPELSMPPEAGSNSWRVVYPPGGVVDSWRGVHTPPFRALIKGMYPESDTFKEQHTPSLQGGVVDFTVQTILVSGLEDGQDIILAFYRNPDLRESVLDFFGQLSGSHELAAAIMPQAAALDLPPALAFALCWEESRYNARAFNQNRNETVDRGLFQLNSATFPDLAVEDFYDLEINARLGLAHLRWCLDTAGTDVAGLAMYNAGTTRVRSAGTPKGTLDYISRILKNQRKMEELFIAGCTLISQEGEEEEIEEKAPFRLSLLAPLGGR